MKTVKYLFVCLLKVLDVPHVFSVKDFIFGIIQLVLFFSVFVFFEVLLNWYFALLLTIGVVITLYSIICLVEFIVLLIKKKHKKTFN